MLPNINDLSRWAVIACDQFTSQPEYWDEVEKIAGSSPSAYNLILPEARLKADNSEAISRINESMADYLQRGIFTEYKNSYIYVEREMLDGSTRRGIIGAVDLEEYDYRPGTSPMIRATEETVSERIPPRKLIRRNAPLELSHVILLCDDERREIIEPLTLAKHSITKLYDFNLMLGGGRIRGWLVRGDHKRALNMRISSYIKRKSRELSLVFAVGDGNHSLASAKACYEEGLTSRYAMVELENIHDEALKFEPIHRIVKNIDPENFIAEIKDSICSKSDSWPVKFFSGGKEGVIKISKSKGASALIVLQKYLDEKGCEIDYIHDTEALKELSNENGCLGFQMPEFDESAKRDFFKVISESGTLPRKTFSMGHAKEKRYYLEARRIQ
ncbi:MAG: DUF1015 domain-containing protein [Synergistaceae bacterium]|nr:DUF1015 domain-containing protein [Synergistaceae bacterium]